MKLTIQIIILISFSSSFFISCKNKNEKRDELKMSSNKEMNNVIWEIKGYSKDEVLNLLKSNTVNNQIIIDTNLQIVDTIRIGNKMTGDIREYALIHLDSVYCFKKGNKIFFVLNNLFFTYNSDNYCLVLEEGKIKILHDSLNMHHACFTPGINTTLKQYRLTFNKSNYSIGDTFKCRALFINQGKCNDDTKDKDSTVYFLDSIDAKYVVHAYGKNIEPYISGFPK